MIAPRICRPSSGGIKSGFTLVELLAVLAVICVLAALLTPVGMKVMDASRSARCVNNLKKIGEAVHLYAADNDGKYPRSRLQLDADGSTVPFLYSALNSYLRLSDVTKLWWCPGDLKRPVEKRAHSYGQNQEFGGNNALPIKRSGVPNGDYHPGYATLKGLENAASNVIYLIDYEDQDDAKWSSPVSGARWPMKKNSNKDLIPSAHVDFSRHSNVANALFLDGSVRGLTFENLVGTQTAHFRP